MGLFDIAASTVPETVPAAERGPAENLQVLSYGHDELTRMNCPIERIVHYGDGRGYKPAFSDVWSNDENVDSMRCASVRAVMMRALQWLARKPAPWQVSSDSPGETFVSLRGGLPKQIGSCFDSKRFNTGRVLIVAVLISCGPFIGFAAASEALLEEFGWHSEGAICASRGSSGTRETVRHSTSTGWGWGAYSANSAGAAGVYAKGTEIRFERSNISNANCPGSYVYTVFSSSGGRSPDRVINLSGVGAAFKIRVNTDATYQTIRWMIRDGSGLWYISHEATWKKRLPVSTDPEHLWAYPVSMYRWNRAMNPNLNDLDDEGAQPLQIGAIATPNLATVTGMGIYVERSSGDAPFAISGLKLSENEPIIYAPPNQATHWFEGMNGLRVGLSQLSGAIFNELYWGIVDPTSRRPVNLIPAMNGRAVNFAFRSMFHRGVWNPIQSGYWEEFGRPVEVISSASSVDPSRRRYSWGPVPMSLWHGDGRYDFCQFEDLTYGQPYVKTGAGPHKDADSLPEVGLSQADEVISDFDMSGFYEDVSSVAANVLALRIVHYADFVRLGNSTRQFNSRGTLVNGESVIDMSAKEDDLSDILPGNQPSTETDMTRVPVIWSDRFDRQFANMKWFWIWSGTGWDIVPLDRYRSAKVTNATLTVIADSGDLSHADSCHGVGLYYPTWAENNRYPIVGVETATGDIVYEESRRYVPDGAHSETPATQIAQWRADTPPHGENRDITGNYTMRSLQIYLKGILSPDHGLQGCHERIRKENYWIFGTPDAIRGCVTKIEGRLKSPPPVAPGRACITAMPGEMIIPNGAGGVSLAPTLRWWPGVRSDSCDVYFGTSAASVGTAIPGSAEQQDHLASKFGASSLSGTYKPGRLQSGKTYFWRIDAVNASAVTKGTVWSFTTVREAARATTLDPFDNDKQ